MKKHILTSIVLEESQSENKILQFWNIKITKLFFN